MPKQRTGKKELFSFKNIPETKLKKGVHLTSHQIEINEKVCLARYNPKWPTIAHREISKLKKVLGKTALGIEHHGSTSVTGMVSKPIVDILLGTETLNLNETVRKKLKLLGYHYIGKRLGQERLYLIKRGRTNFNLGIVKYGSKTWQDNLAFRDYLQSHPKAASDYARRKKEILNRGKNTLFEYSDAKATLIEKFAKRARRWKQKNKSKRNIFNELFEGILEMGLHRRQKIAL